MRVIPWVLAVLFFLPLLWMVQAEDVLTTNTAPPAAAVQNCETTHTERWNFHVQNTDIVQYHPSFPAQYSGPNSLSASSEVKETVSLDLMTGFRPWTDAGFYVDGLMWQGFGFSKTYGVAGFPNGEAFRVGTTVPDFTFARVFLRQTFGVGGEQENVEDAALQLSGKQDVRRITLTVGKISVKDIFDNNAYANDPRTQFQNWSLMANGAWDYPADSLGFISGVAVELNQPQWAARAGIFQVPKVSNGLAHDWNVLKAWSLVTELERRWALSDHPGVVRLLGYLERADMGSFQAALDSPTPADLVATREYRSKYGFGLNANQEIIKNVGLFSRLGWNNGETEPWVFTDVDWTGSLGVSIKGESWHRPNDTLGTAFVLNGLSPVHEKYLAAGGTGILVGDGNLTYGLEKIVETYYDFQIWKTIHGAIDFQFIENPGFNQTRGPVPVIGARLHSEF